MISDGHLPQSSSKDVEEQLQKDQKQQNDKITRYQNKNSSAAKHGSTKMGKIKTKKVLKKTRFKKYSGKATDPRYATSAESPISIRQFSPILSNRDDQTGYPVDTDLHYNQDIKNSIEALAIDENYPLPPIQDGQSILHSINLNKSEEYSPLKIHIDLRELQARAAQFTEDEQSIMNKQFRLSSRELSAIKTGKELLSGLERTMGKDRFSKSDKERYYSPLSDYRMSIPAESRGLVSKNSKFRDIHDANEEDEVLTTHFRLSGIKAATTAVDPTEELIMNKQEVGKEMRVAREICKEVLKEKKKPPFIEKNITLNGQQRLYKKLYEAMNLSILRSVDQVHRDWNKSEKAIQKIDTISNRRFVNEVQKERIRQYQRYKVMIAREGGIQDKIISSDALKVIEEEKERENLRVQFARQELNEKTKQRLEELALNTDFNCQATAISRVIRQYDNKKHRNEVIEKNAEVVRATQDKAVEKRHMVKKYLEHKRMVQRAVNQVEKKKINGKLLEEANDRIMQAKARVAYLKQRHRVASDYCKVKNTLLATEQPNRNATSMGITVDDHL